MQGRQGKGCFCERELKPCCFVGKLSCLYNLSSTSTTLIWHVHMHSHSCCFGRFYLSPPTSFCYILYVWKFCIHLNVHACICAWRDVLTYIVCLRTCAHNSIFCSFFFMNTIIQATGDIEEHFKSKIMEPRVVVFEDSAGMVQMFLCAENESIMELPSTNILDGVSWLRTMCWELAIPVHAGHLSCFFRSM